MSPPPAGGDPRPGLGPPQPLAPRRLRGLLRRGAGRRLRLRRGLPRGSRRRDRAGRGLPDRLGWLRVRLDLGARECVDDPACAGPCAQQSAAGDGRYRIEAVAGAEVAGCVDPNACTCTPNAEGWCEVAADAVAGETVEALASVDYPVEVEALLVFE
ncbi:MAG: hypothetical protein R3B09_17965 [Nannocystaceae bacterium]